MQSACPHTCSRMTSDASRWPHPHEGVLVDELDQVILQLIHQLLWGLPQLLQDVIHDSLRIYIYTLVSANACYPCTPGTSMKMTHVRHELCTMPHARRPKIVTSQATMICFMNRPRNLGPGRFKAIVKHVR